MAGWWDLVGIIQEARDVDDKERSGTPSSCAQCYTPLQGGPNGTLYCPWDGLVWPDDRAAWGEFPGAF